MIGLKRGTVELLNHTKEWELEAERTISHLCKVLGSAAKDIQHVGSTSIPTIKAKPIIDIALAVDNFTSLLAFEAGLKEAGFYYCPHVEIKNQLLFACGSYYEGSGDLQTHFIHVVLAGSREWANYLNFRDYLNKKPEIAKAYEDLKISLLDRGREEYLKGKHNFISHTSRKALAASYLGKDIKIIIDRPMGSSHPKYPGLIYPINYGYVPGLMAGDGEEFDVYLLGVKVPLREYSAPVIAVVHRHDDVEDKLVAAPKGISFSKNDIEKAVHFQEQYFMTEIETMP